MLVSRNDCLQYNIHGISTQLSDCSLLYFYFLSLSNEINCLIFVTGNNGIWNQFSEGEGEKRFILRPFSSLVHIDPLSCIVVFNCGKLAWWNFYKDVLHRENFYINCLFLDHHLCSSGEPHGWHHQLKREPLRTTWCLLNSLVYGCHP